MVESLRAWALLAGYRGRPAVDVDCVVETLVRISYLIDEQPDVLELDVNPLLATPGGAVALDARIVVAAAPPAPRPSARSSQWARDVLRTRV
jgi:acetyltransferase